MKVYFAKNSNGYFYIRANVWNRSIQNLELVEKRGHATLFLSLYELEDMRKQYELSADSITIEEFELENPKELNLKEAQILAGWNR